QEAEARQDLLHDRARDLALGGREIEAAEEGERIADGKRRHLDDAPPPDAHEARLAAEPRALAGRAPPVAHQAFQVLPEPRGARLLLAAPAERDEARERPADGAAAMLELDLLLSRALEEDGSHGGRQVLEGRTRAEAAPWRRAPPPRPAPCRRRAGRRPRASPRGASPRPRARPADRPAPRSCAARCAPARCPRPARAAHRPRARARSRRGGARRAP